MELILDFQRAVADVIARKVPMPERIAMLREFRDKGLTADAAAEALEQMRAGKEEEIVDHIEDLLDIATGWCSASWLVWPAGPPRLT
jgi:hypothetical protein